MEGGGGEPFACVDCGRRCGREEDIRRHLELECGTRPRLECPECPFRTIWEEALESHWTRKHGRQGEAFVCTGCGDGFPSAAPIKKHLRLYCPKLSIKTFPCSKCDRVCLSKRGLTKHFSKCSGQLQCLSCPFRPATKQNLRYHIRRRHGPEVLAIYYHVKAHSIDFTCLDCDRKFDTKPQLEVHLLERCAKEAKYECPVCFKRLYNWHVRQAHIVKTHGEDSLRKIRQAKHLGKPYKCTNCRKGFAFKSSISQHLPGCGKPPTRQCPECPYITCIERTLRSHILDHHGVDAYEKAKSELNDKVRAQRAFPCPQCKRSFSEKMSLKRHLKYDCGTLHKCPECPAVLNTRCTLTAHIARKHRLIPRAKEPPVTLPCERCGRSFPPDSLIQHQMKPCKPPIQCPECPKQYSSLQFIKEHLGGTHGQDALNRFISNRKKPVSGKRYQCNKCNRSLRNKQYFTEHVSVCGQPPTQQCPECPYITRLTVTLKVHVKNQHGVDVWQRMQLQKIQKWRAGKAFPCPYCERAFSAKLSLSRHLKYDCGKLHKCPECPVVLNSQACLRVHVRRKHGESALAKVALPVKDKPYNCAHCGRGYSHRKTLQAHLKNCK